MQLPRCGSLLKNSSKHGHMRLSDEARAWSTAAPYMLQSILFPRIVLTALKKPAIRAITMFLVPRYAFPTSKRQGHSFTLPENHCPSWCRSALEESQVAVLHTTLHLIVQISRGLSEVCQTAAGRSTPGLEDISLGQ